MKTIEGFEAAKKALSRRSPSTSYPVSPRLKQGLKKMFGVEDPERVVQYIIQQVREKGDTALRELTLKIDNITLESIEINRRLTAPSYKLVDKKVVAALQMAAENITAFHEAQKRAIWRETNLDGLRQLVRPIERVGVYAPGGTAAYPSTVLMTAIPARIAGVSEIVLCTPPRPEGGLSPLLIVAADIAKVDRIFSLGGAQAIAAMAFGTESVPKVDKICGPGNVFVMLAKKSVFGSVDIDGLQGPSEVMVIADTTTDPSYCAGEILAQAEHDTMAGVVLVATSANVADKVLNEVERQLSRLSRKEILTPPIQNGTAAIVASLEEAINLANEFAPEHLCLMFKSAGQYIDKITNAGCVVAGELATVVLGDYDAGPSHALPTGGTARFSSPLNVADFFKYINVINVDTAMVRRLGPSAAALARAEGLDAHARAVEMRLEQSK